jgi:hypothetical protein
VFGYTEPVGRDGSVSNLMFHFLDTDYSFWNLPNLLDRDSSYIVSKARLIWSALTG